VLTYANGGHPPGLLMLSDRSIARLSTTGAVLGAVAGAEWTVETVNLDVGSLLLLYTDGVTEARKGTKFFGEGRVRRVLRAGGDCAAVAQRLLSQVQNHAGGEVRDDVAIVAVRYRQATAFCQDVTPAANSGM
ncbi:serine/threonine-protein phosphatase, partial [bacterium]|nr:serine/threonine-protein phosphatase [bacterium]